MLLDRAKRTKNEGIAKIIAEDNLKAEKYALVVSC